MVYIEVQIRIVEDIYIYIYKLQTNYIRIQTIIFENVY